MGRLFTIGELQARRVPTPDAFSNVEGTVRETLSREMWVVCAGVFGSAARGDHTPSSGLACFVVYRRLLEQKAFTAMIELAKLASSRNVPLQFVCVDTDVAQTGLHSFGPIFVQHISHAFARGGLIKGSLDCLKVACDFQSETVSFVAHRYNGVLKFSARLGSHSEAEYLLGLGSCYESVTRVARQVLGHQGLLQGDDSKAAVERLYRENFGPVLPELLKTAVRLEKDFDALVAESAQTRAVNPGAYWDAVQSLEIGLPLVRGFLRGNLLWLHEHHAA